VKTSEQDDSIMIFGWAGGLALVLIAAILLALIGCTAVGDGAAVVQKGAAAAAPLLPAPWNWILTGVGALAGVVGSVAGGRNKTEIIKEAVAEGRSVQDALGGAGLLTKVLTERKWLAPIAGAALTGANSALGLGLDPETIMQVNLLLGGTALAEFAKDVVVSKVAKEATNGVAPPAPLPPPAPPV
jgi:hypothetical protein